MRKALATGLAAVMATSPLAACGPKSGEKSAPTVSSYSHEYNAEAGRHNLALDLAFGRITCTATVTKEGDQVHIAVTTQPPDVWDMSVSYEWTDRKGTTRGEQPGSDFTVPATNTGSHVHNAEIVAHYSVGEHSVTANRCGSFAIQNA